MTLMEGGLVDRKRDSIGHVGSKVGYVTKVIRKKRKCTRKVKIPDCADSMTLQKLFDSCQYVFKGPGTIPPPCNVQKLCHVLDIMKPEDLGLSTDLQFFRPMTAVKGTPRVTYTTIYSCEKFSLCIFFLPPKAVIPLHNHPEMTVFSKLLLGTMHIKSYDWVDPGNSDVSASTSGYRLARVKADSVFKAPCDTSVLYPSTGGNIHAFTAITACAVLDVMGPPYSREDGRDCSYYRERETISRKEDEQERENVMWKEDEDICYRWLEEIEMPEDSQMDVIEYLGPQIIETTTTTAT